MSVVAKALKVILSPEVEFCCLCLGVLNENCVHINDEIYIGDINNEEVYSDMVDIIYKVFGTEINICVTDGVCQTCTALLISFYKFLKMCKETQQIMKNTTESLNECLEVPPDSHDYYKTLFLSLNPYDFSNFQYFDDTKPFKSLETAKKQYDRILTMKPETLVKDEIYSDEIPDELLEQLSDTTFKIKRSKKCNVKNVNPAIMRKKQYIAIPIATKDMVCDINNLDQPKCKECDREFKGIDSLRQHYIRVHAPKVFKCSECPRSYGSSGLLEAHKSESHVTVVCSQCGKTFYNRSTLKQHELSHQRSIICQDCGRIYKNRNTFKHHKETGICTQKTRKTQKNAQYECDICNKRYSQKGSLRVHMRFEHGGAEYHICSWCGKKFVAPSKLKIHVLTHTQEKKFPCSICGGKFVSKESLVYHTRTHTGETPFACEFCDRKFLSISRRTEHIRRHHMQPEKECDICHIKFKSSSCLHEHRKRHFNPKSRLCNSQDSEED